MSGVTSRLSSSDYRLCVLATGDYPSQALIGSYRSEVPASSSVYFDTRQPLASAEGARTSPNKLHRVSDTGISKPVYKPPFDPLPRQEATAREPAERWIRCPVVR